MSKKIQLKTSNKVNRVRKKILKSICRNRLSVYRTCRHIYAQIFDLSNKRTLVSASTVEKNIKKDIIGNTGNINAARKVGSILAARAIKKNIKKVCFDRSKYRYHGRVKALADSARDFGLDF